MCVPTFPFNNLHKHRLIEVNISQRRADEVHRNSQSDLITRVETLRDNPKSNMDIIVPTIPSMRTGFLPIRSDVRLHWNTVIASVAKNNDSYDEGHSRQY